MEINSKFGVDVIGHDCTNHGVTSRQTSILLQLSCGNFDVTDGKASLMLDVEVDADPSVGKSGYLLVAKREFIKLLTGVARDGVICRVKAKPAGEHAGRLGRPMFGGHFITSSDSRFPFHSPIPVFDRFE